MEIRKLDDKKLLSDTLEIVRKEKQLTAQVLKHLVEIERRRLFVDLGFNSLFKYCTEYLGYSENEAGCRISAMRLIKGSRKIEEKIESGKLNLTSATKVQSHIRHEEKERGFKFTEEEKNEVVEIIVGKSTRETEQILDGLKIIPPKKQIKITIEENTAKKFEEFKRLKGNYSDDEILNLLLDEKLEQIKAEREKKKDVEVKEAKSKNQRYISKKMREKVLARANYQCEHVSTITGIRCTEKRYLELDHTRPIALGGQGCLDNLRVLCSACNKRMAIKSLGVEKMYRFIN